MTHRDHAARRSSARSPAVRGEPRRAPASRDEPAASAAPSTDAAAERDPRLQVDPEGLAGLLDPVHPARAPGRARLAAGHRRPGVIWLYLPVAERQLPHLGQPHQPILQITAVGIIAIGVVLVLLLGEIDLSVGVVSGLAAAVMAVLNVKHGWAPMPVDRRRPPGRRRRSASSTASSSPASACRRSS